jgi:hypothetical protein
MQLEPVSFFKAFFSPFVVEWLLIIFAFVFVRSYFEKRIGAWIQKQKLSLKGATAGLCPLCNGPLVLRKARRGANAGKDFYGCSNFPRCRYTKPL